MRYSKAYTSWYLRLNIHTNSRRMRELIDNFLDFRNVPRANPRMKIDFYLNEVNFTGAEDNKNFIYDIWAGKNIFAEKIAIVKVRPEARVVNADIINYREAHKERLLNFVFMKPLYLILEQHGLLFLHASVVCRDNDCILISGPKYSGKSTLALTLMRDGFGLLADDDCFIKLIGNNTKLFPFPTKMGVTDTVLRKYRKLNKYLLRKHNYGGKQRLSLDSVYGFDETKDYKCKIIIFPKYDPKGKVRVKPVSNKGSINRLIKHREIKYHKGKDSLYDRDFWALYNLTNKANAFELTYNDGKLNEIPKIIQGIF